MHCDSVLSLPFSSKDLTSTMKTAGWRERVRVGRGITVASVDFRLPLTKSHHFRRLTSACDKCSTSSSLPISLEPETPEASAACKIKNDHLIHSSTKYISGERKKWVRGRGRQTDREGALPYFAGPQFLLNEALIQMACEEQHGWGAAEFLVFPLSLGVICTVSVFCETHRAPHAWSCRWSLSCSLQFTSF